MLKRALCFFVLVSTSAFAETNSFVLSDICNDFLSGQLARSNPDSLLLRQLRAMPELTSSEFHDLVNSPLNEALSSIGRGTAYTSERIQNDGSLLAHYLEPIVQGLKGLNPTILEEVELATIYSPAGIYRSPTFGDFKSKADYISRIARLVLSSANVEKMTMKSWLAGYLSAEAAIYHYNHGTLRGFALADSDAVATITTHKGAAYYRGSFTIGGHSIHSAYHPILMTNETYANEMNRLLDGESRESVTAATDVARFVYENGSKRLDLITQNLFKRALAKFPHEKVDLVTYDLNPNYRLSIKDIANYADSAYSHNLLRDHSVE